MSHSNEEPIELMATGDLIPPEGLLDATEEEKAQEKRTVEVAEAKIKAVLDELYTSGENDEERESVEKAIKELLYRLEMRYSNRNAYPFHHKLHSYRVLILSQIIVETLKPEMSKAEKLASLMAPLGHDMVMNSIVILDTEETRTDTARRPLIGKNFRTRGADNNDTQEVLKAPAFSQTPKDIIGNEESSFLELEDIIKKSGIQEPLCSEIIELSRKAIEATYPAVAISPIPADEIERLKKEIPHLKNGDIDISRYLIPNKEGGFLGLRFSQPHLTEESPFVALMIATADLAYPGIVPSKDEFRNETGISPLPEIHPQVKSKFEPLSNGEFKEIYQKLSYSIQNPNKKENLGIDAFKKEELEYATTQMITWLKDQVAFLIWQKLNFEENTKGNMDFKNLFNQFDTNIASSMIRYDTYADEMKPDTATFFAQTSIEDLRAFTKKLAVELGYTLS